MHNRLGADMEPTLVVTLGDVEFPMSGVTLQEMYKVTSTTRYKNKREWFAAIQDDEPEALIAAYVMAKARAGETVRFNDANFDLDDMAAKLVDETGREVEPVLEKNPDGSLKFTENDDGSQGTPIPVLDGQGQPQWVYSDTGEPVRPTSAAEPPTSVTPPMPGPPSESVSGTPQMSTS